MPSDSKLGWLTVAGKPSDGGPPYTSNSTLNQVGLKGAECARCVIEKAEENYSACAADPA